MKPSNKKIGIIVLAMGVGSVFYYLNFNSKEVHPDYELRKNRIPQEKKTNPEKILPEKKQSQPDSSSQIQEDFKQLTYQAMQRFPTVEELRQLSPGELHHTPKRIVEAGLEIGKVVEALEAHPEIPELQETGARFFESCSTQENLPTSVRAVCFLRLKKQDPRRAEDIDIPQNVRALSEKI